MSWVEMKISDLYKVSSSKRVLKSDWKSEGIPFYRGREITTLSKYGYVENELYITEEMYKDFSSNYGIPVANDIMVTAIGTIGNTFIVRESDKFYFKDASVLWLKKIKEVNSNFVNYWFKSRHFTNQLEVGLGATVDSLTIGKVQSLKINVPPIPVQDKLVSKLDAIFTEIDKAVAAAEANVKNAVVIFYSVLNKLLDKNKLGWNSLQLKEACTFINRGIAPSYLDNDEGILILNQKCVRNHKIAYDLGRRHDVLRKKVKEEKLIRYGDVLVNSTGTGTLGRIAQVVDEILQPITVDTHVTIVRPNLNKLSANFFGFMMIQIEEDIKKAGEGSVGQTELSRTILSEKFKVVFPNDKKLQKSLYLQLSSVKENSSKFKNLIEIKIKELNLLKQAVLKKAFNGELVKAA